MVNINIIDIVYFSVDYLVLFFILFWYLFQAWSVKFDSEKKQIHQNLKKHQNYIESDEVKMARMDWTMKSITNFLENESIQVDDDWNKYAAFYLNSVYFQK